MENQRRCSKDIELRNCSEVRESRSQSCISVATSSRYSGSKTEGQESIISRISRYSGSKTEVYESSKTESLEGKILRL